jgi:alkanesulfonate monooxygenase SsuD/methylene tetrahydromethanopterin reductase-like flavin-dependent oxidoreductase (luciferase family)
VTLGQRLDSAGVDAIIVVDDNPLALRSGARPGPPRFDALTVGTMIASVTGRLGVIASETAVHGFPYHVARRFATLDHVAGGRVGWLTRVSNESTQHDSFEFDATDASDEVPRAAEFIDVALGLWNTWEPGAERPDKATGEFKDDTRIHPLQYESDRFFVAGPLDTPRSPQGRPAVMIPVATNDDVELAARFADVVLVRTDDLDTAIELSHRIAAAVVEAEREGEVRTLISVSPVAIPSAILIAGAADSALPDASQLVEACGADGIDLVTDGTEEFLDWLPPISESSPATLLDRLGLSPVARHGRRAA